VHYGKKEPLLNKNSYEKFDGTEEMMPGGE